MYHLVNILLRAEVIIQTGCKFVPVGITQAPHLMRYSSLVILIHISAILLLHRQDRQSTILPSLCVVTVTVSRNKSATNLAECIFCGS